MWQQENANIGIFYEISYLYFQFEFASAYYRNINQWFGAGGVTLFCIHRGLHLILTCQYTVHRAYQNNPTFMVMSNLHG